MGEGLGNLNDLRHSCHRHGLTDLANRWLDIGDVERCDCGRLWFVFNGGLGRRWKPLKGRRLRRWQAMQSGREAGR
jgi:hypothetical protein